MSVISWYGRPILSFTYQGMPVQYCVWGDGFRLYSVNGFAAHQLNNCIFSHWLELVSRHHQEASA
jgi:hypothetical protein